MSLFNLPTPHKIRIYLLIKEGFNHKMKRNFWKIQTGCWKDTHVLLLVLDPSPLEKLFIRQFFFPCLNREVWSLPQHWGFSALLSKKRILGGGKMVNNKKDFLKQQWTWKLQFSQLKMHSFLNIKFANVHQQQYLK